MNIAIGGHIERMDYHKAEQKGYRWQGFIPLENGVVSIRIRRLGRGYHWRSLGQQKTGKDGTYQFILPPDFPIPAGYHAVAEYAGTKKLSQTENHLRFYVLTDLLDSTRSPTIITGDEMVKELVRKEQRHRKKKGGVVA